MIIDQIDLDESRLERLVDLRIMVECQFCSENGVITIYDDMGPCCMELLINSNCLA